MLNFMTSSLVWLAAAVFFSLFAFAVLFAFEWAFPNQSLTPSLIALSFAVISPFQALKEFNGRRAAAS